MRAFNPVPGGQPAPATLVTGEATGDRVAVWFGGVLDDSYLLLRNLHLPNAPTPVDLLLIGPPGVWALYLETDAGQYRAEGKNFLAWEAASGGYVKLNPNPLDQLRLVQAQLRGLLNVIGLPPDSARTAVLFTDASAKVETVNSEVRLVGPNEIETFAVEIARLKPVLDPAATERVLNAVAGGQTPEPPPGDDEAEADEPRPARPALLKRFSPRQWIVLGVLGFLDACLICAAAVYFIFFNK